MSLVFAFAIYFVVWWVVFIAVLPFGVTTQAEQGMVTPGTVESAPVTPAIFRKVIITTFVSALIFGVIYSVLVFDIIALDDIPILLEFAPIDQ